MKNTIFNSIYRAAHDEQYRNDPFVYLLCNDGSLHVTVGKSQFLKRHFCEQLPSGHWDVGKLPVVIGQECGITGTSAIMCSKKVAIKLREWTALFLRKGD